MSGLSKYPPPPSSYRDWQTWATQLINFMTRNSDLKEPTDPRPILLAHKLGVQTGNLGMERTTTDGVLMFDPSLGKLVVSVGGVWKVVALE